MDEFSHFLPEGGTLDPILVSLCKHGRRGSGALVVNNGSGMHFPGVAGKDAPRAVFPAIAARSACTSVEQFRQEFWALFFISPLYFAEFSTVGTLRQVIFWEPSTTKSSSLSRARGVAGSPGVRLPGDLPPISLSDSSQR